MCAYIEVPNDADQLTIDAPSNAEVTWLPRGGAQAGEPLADALGWHVEPEASDEASEDLLWETPVFSASGEDLAVTDVPRSGTYYWIAGESGVIKRLRRFLVREVGVDRAQWPSWGTGATALPCAANQRPLSSVFLHLKENYDNFHDNTAASALA